MSKEEIYNLYTQAVEAGMSIKWAAQCAHEVQDRLDRGLSFDCDEYRALLRVLNTASYRRSLHSDAN